MKNFSTRCIKKRKEVIDEENKQDKSIGPKRQTLDFIKQFARVYHSENTLDIQLVGLVLN